MSRHVVEHRQDILVSFGWDRPMQTFFAQAEDFSKEPDEQLLFDMGDKFRPYQSLEAFCEAFAAALIGVGISDFPSLSQAELARLEADRRGLT